MVLRQCSPDVTLIPKWRVAFRDATRKERADSDVVVLEGRVERLAATASAIAVQMRDEPVARRFDILYPAFGSRPRSELAKRLGALADDEDCRSEEHTSELQSLMRISYAVFCLKKKITN